MRILTSVGCTIALFPLLGSTVQANTTKIEPKEQFSVQQAEIAPQYWTTQAESLDSVVAPNEASVADNSWSESDSEAQQEPQEVLFQLQNLGQYNFAPNRGAPSLTIANPSGFGADGGQFYSGFSYQTDTRFGDDENQDDGTFGFGFAFGDAVEAVGVEIGYTMASFGGSRDFGSGGFNAKVHHLFPDNWAVAAGWNGFLNIGGGNDFEDSLYLTTTKVFRTRENLDSAFSRVAVTVGVGNGQFRTEDAIEDGEEGFNVFGSLAFRVARPVSGIVEWTGQDLAVGASVSPFRRVPVTFNVSLRDLTGAGDEPRLVFGLGTGF